MRNGDTAEAIPKDGARLGRIGRYPVRWHTALLTVWTALWFVVAERHGAVSWHYLKEGEELLFSQVGDGGLALYANHPELQIGPVSFVVAALFAPFDARVGENLAEAFMSGLGLYMLVLIGRTAAEHNFGTGLNHKRLQQRVLIAGAAFIPMWVEVSVRFAHLDDVLALFFTTLAVRALVRGNATAVGVMLALAVDSKPWAVGFLPLLLALPRPSRLRAGAWVVGLVAAAWLPFYLTHLETFHAARFTIPNQPASSLRWFGVNDPATPWWDRPAQMSLGMALGALAVRRHRWPAVVLLAADARIVLDPSVYTYYNASVLLGTLIWDSIGQRRLVPWVSWIALISLYGSALLVPSDSTRGLIRLAFAVGSALYVLWWPQRTPRGKRRTRTAAPLLPEQATEPRYEEPPGYPYEGKPGSPHEAPGPSREEPRRPRVPRQSSPPGRRVTSQARSVSSSAYT
ncbi:hypothetical protein RKE30_00575 [Streptomyces sp. Li-HN-5-11]|uniref:hypothetical protein n=1 Tax=Streptomyces sp. Li-HN-5-11 TaxID=3075432 RepID=UPI0028AC5B56|nr:hypothetical protein [Streptomyces sp. Li-HN-5-11]WNM29004.1 hypothetical protein RKE30_00575 [Streptomyces sp. Li-HN-5-11]